jgi:hypothetical protein
MTPTRSTSILTRSSITNGIFFISKNIFKCFPSNAKIKICEGYNDGSLQWQNRDDLINLFDQKKIFLLEEPDFTYRINGRIVHEDRLVLFTGNGVLKHKYIFSGSMETTWEDIQNARSIRERMRVASKASSWH